MTTNDPFIAEAIRDLQNSPAGLLLTQYGFEVVHQGGSIVNFEKTVNGHTYQVVVKGGHGEGPENLSEPVQIYVDAEDEALLEYSSLASFRDV